MQREWTNIDVLRMEKFLLLTRRYLGASFGVLRKGGWEEKEVAEMLSVLGEVPLNVGDMRVPNGLRFHVIDIYVDELERAGALEGKVVPLENLLEPLRKLAKESPTKPIRTKAKEALEDERLLGNKKLEAEKESEVKEEAWDRFED